ncbi:hypothetical protein ACQY1Q_15705 [Tenacibaculum sp. TC6]|uniref:hypothetical protein n=1 Tax=Tenacibaculum sp. TC6 TaxID=3423223 RepID=UPI003D35A528
MNNQLNEQYFETKQKHKEGYKKHKKKAATKWIRNLVVTFLLIFIYNSMLKTCSKKIEENKKKNIEINRD